MLRYFNNFLYHILGDEVMGFLFKTRNDELEVKNADGIVEDGIVWKDGEAKGKLETKVMTFKKYNDRIIKEIEKKKKERKKFVGKKLQFYELYGGLINPDNRKDVYESWLKSQEKNKWEKDKKDEIE